jgi:hypothetical protein
MVSSSAKTGDNRLWEVGMKRFLRGMFYNVTIFQDMVSFLWKEKLWFLIPVVALLLIIGLLLIFSTASGIAPVIYTLF